MQLIIGENYFVRTSAGIDYVGRLEEIDGPHTITLSECSWVANTGRFHEFIAKGRAANMEIEPIGDFMVHYSGIAPWPHKLFTEAV